MKGFWYVIEAIIAVSLLMFFIVAGGSILINAPSVDIAEKGYNILKGLDNQGVLRPYIQSDDPYGLNQEIDLPGFLHTVEICDSEGICKGERPPQTENVFIATYIVSGKDFFDPKTVILYIYT